MDWIGSLLTVLSVYITGKKKWYGWVFSIAGQVVWMYVGIASHMYSLALLNLVMLSLAIHNLISWKK